MQRQYLPVLKAAQSAGDGFASGANCVPNFLMRKFKTQLVAIFRLVDGPIQDKSGQFLRSGLTNQKVFMFLLRHMVKIGQDLRHPHRCIAMRLNELQK